MTNLEKHKTAIISAVRLFGDLPAMVDGYFQRCNFQCDKCQFSIDEIPIGESCLENFIQWATQECEE